MAYSVGGVIQASDINGWINTINSVYGVGTGDTGYGQTTLQDAISAGNVITSAQWENLRTMMARCIAHQGISATNLVPSNLLDAGDTIFAHVGGTGNNAYNFADLITSIQTNRLLNSGSGMSLLNSATSTPSPAFANWTQFRAAVTFTSEDHARHFFNTGGEIRMTLSAAAGSSLASSTTAKSNDWKSIMSAKVGTVALKASSSSRTGNSGTPASTLGYYGLTAGVKPIFSGNNIGGSAYASNDVNVVASVSNVAGVRGGNGTTIDIQVQLMDDHAAVDNVLPGIIATFDVYKVGTLNLPISISSPFIAVTNSYS